MKHVALPPRPVVCQYSVRQVRFGEKQAPVAQPGLSRRTFLTRAALGVGLLGSAGLFCYTDPLDLLLSIPKTSIEAAKRASARFNVTMPTPQGMQKASNGSGFFFADNTGKVWYLTNEHNVGEFQMLGIRHPMLKMPRFTIAMEDGTEFQTLIKGTSPRYAHDIAVMTVPETLGKKLRAENKVLSFANLSEVPMTEQALKRKGAFTCGYPGDGPQRVETGRIEEVNTTSTRPIYFDGAHITERLGSGTRIVSSVRNESGMSGAPFCLENGQVIGLSTQSSGARTNYAVALDSIKAFLETLNIPVLASGEHVDVSAFRATQSQALLQFNRRQTLFRQLLTEATPTLSNTLARMNANIDVVAASRPNYELFDLFLNRYNLPDENLTPNEMLKAKGEFPAFFRRNPLTLLGDTISVL